MKKKVPNTETLATLGNPTPLKDQLAHDKAMAKIQAMFPPECQMFLNAMVFRQVGVELVAVELLHGGSATVELRVHIALPKEYLQ